MAGPYLQVALEQAPNYENATNDVSTDVFYPVVQSIEMDDGFEALEEQDYVRGFLAPMPHLGAAEYKPKVKLGKMHPRPADLGWMFAAIMGPVSGVVGDGSTTKDPSNANYPAGAYKYAYEFANTEPPQTLQLQGCSGDGKFVKGTGFGCEEIAFSYDGGVLSADMSLVGLYLDEVSDPSITPVLSTAPPFRRGDMTLTWLGSSAHTTDFDFKVTSQIEAVAEPTVASLYPNLLQYQADALPTISGTIAKQSLETADIAALEAGTQFAATIKIVSRDQVGSTGYYSTLWVVMPGCQLISLDRDPIEAKRRREGKYTWEARYDASTGKLATVTVINEQSAYATYGA